MHDIVVLAHLQLLGLLGFIIIVVCVYSTGDTLVVSNVKSSHEQVESVVPKLTQLPVQCNHDLYLYKPKINYRISSSRGRGYY